MKISIDNNALLEIGKIFNQDEANRMMGDFLVDYIENSREVAKLATSSVYKALIKYYEVDKDFKAELVKYQLDKNIKLLDINEYLNNPYAKNIKLDNIKEKEYEYIKQYYLPYEGFLCDEIETTNEFLELTKIGYFNTKYECNSLVSKDVIWMLITPHEINTMKKPVENASGNILVLGLGLGYYPYMCSLKEEVKSITIVENDKKIIDMFNKYILPQFEHKDKINIVYEDGFKALENNNYDYTFVDIYHDVDDGMELFLKANKLLINKNHDLWIEKSFIVILRRLLISLIYEEIYQVENDYTKEENIYDHIVNHFHNELIDYSITNVDDVKNLLDEKSIYKLIRNINV